MTTPTPFQSAALELRERDERLRIAIDAVGPCALVPNDRSPYEALLGAIAHQQVHGAAAKAILGRMHALYARAGGPPRWPTPDELAATPDEALRGAGLSRSKVLAMRDVAAKTLDGTVPDLATIAELSNEAIIERLVAVRGVGRWTAEMLLIFTLGRPDVLPVDDYGVRYGFQLLHGKRRMPKPRWLAAYGERWRPHRSIVAWYLWRYVDWVRANGLEPRRVRAKAARAKAADAKGARAARAKAARGAEAATRRSGRKDLAQARRTAAATAARPAKVVRAAKSAAVKVAKLVGSSTSRAPRASTPAVSRAASRAPTRGRARR